VVVINKCVFAQDTLSSVFHVYVSLSVITTILCWCW